MDVNENCNLCETCAAWRPVLERLAEWSKRLVEDRQTLSRYGSRYPSIDLDDLISQVDAVIMGRPR